MYKNQSDSVMNNRFIPRRKYAFLLCRPDIDQGKCLYSYGMSEKEFRERLDAELETYVISDVVEKAIQNMMYDPDRQAKFDG